MQLSLGTIEAGWTFTGWSPSLIDDKVTILGNTEVTATFSQEQYALTVVSAHAPVTKTPDLLTYTYGQEVQLSLGTIEAGWTFTGWSASLIDDKVTINGNTDVTATFNQDQYTLTVVSAHAPVTKNPDR